jgi:serine/threonine-protein kinase
MQPVQDLVVADRFRLTRLLGRGGMGSVWLAHHMGLDIPCAVKFIEGEFAQVPEAQARFEREAKAAAQLRSPHVVQILDHGVWQGTPYMAMELLEGEDFGKRLQRIGRMSPQEVCAIITQVTRALTKAHAAGIVHRDLKPDNIYLVKDDDREIAKVLDFGIAKSSTALDGGNTKTGAMLGTPYYMSPEQAQGIKAVDHRSDLWSLAIIVFQALTGRLPFESEALGDLLVKIIVAPVPMPSQFAPDLPASLDRWWLKAANRDPAQRYQSAKELSDGLALVFGQSQLTDVMDRSELQAAMARLSGGAAGGYVQANTPGYGPVGSVPSPNPYPQPVQGGMSTPQPAHGATPQPMQGAGQPFGGTPHPATHVITGGPMARTFGEPPAPPKNKAGLLVGIGAAVVVVALAAVVGGMAMKSKKDGPVAAAGGGPASTSSVAPAVSTAPVVLAPPPTATASAAASVAAIEPAAPAPSPSPSPAAPGAPAKPHAATGGGTQPAPAAPAAPKPAKKPADIDLGI